MAGLSLISLEFDRAEPLILAIGAGFAGWFLWHAWQSKQANAAQQAVADQTSALVNQANEISLLQSLGIVGGATSTTTNAQTGVTYTAPASTQAAGGSNVAYVLSPVGVVSAPGSVTLGNGATGGTVS